MRQCCRRRHARHIQATQRWQHQNNRRLGELAEVHVPLMERLAIADKDLTHITAHARRSEKQAQDLSTSVNQIDRTLVSVAGERDAYAHQMLAIIRASLWRRLIYCITGNIQHLVGRSNV